MPRSIRLSKAKHVSSTRKPARHRISIDDELLAEALQLTGASSTRDVIEQSLQLLVRLKRQERLRGVRGRLRWSSDLDLMRRD
jgi:Arc/MetJ family transcription regulator